MKFDVSKITFEHWKTFVPRDRTETVQDFTVVGGRLVLSQDFAFGKQLRLTRFTLPTAIRFDERDLTDMGHGDQLGGGGGQVLLRRRSGAYCAYDWDTKASHGVAWPPRALPFYKAPRGHWFQGETVWRNGNQPVLIRNWGCPWDATGAIYKDQTVVKPHLTIHQADEKPISVPLALHRDAKGHPIGGKQEQEGASMIKIDGVPKLCIGVCSGRKGHYALEVFAADLAKAVVV